jgi:hypothetical protein
MLMASPGPRGARAAGVVGDADGAVGDTDGRLAVITAGIAISPTAITAVA